MAWQDIYPQLVGGVQPISDTLTVVATVGPSANIYGTIFVVNISDGVVEKVRLALRPNGSVSVSDDQYILYDSDIEPNNIVQLSNIALNSGDSVVGWSGNGLAVFNFTGDEIRNYF
jgi:hypothetical protein